MYIAKLLESGYDCDSDFSLVKAFGLLLLFKKK